MNSTGGKRQNAFLLKKETDCHATKTFSSKTIISITQNMCGSSSTNNKKGHDVKKERENQTKYANYQSQIRQGLQYATNGVNLPCSLHQL